MSGQSGRGGEAERSATESVGQVKQAALSSGAHSSYAMNFVNAGYKCKVNDEFGGVMGSGQAKTYIDSSKWTFQNLYVNNEAQNYTNRQCVDMPTGNWNYCQENGKLTIRATTDSLNCASDPACATYFKGTGGTRSYSSGRMMSQHKVARNGGYIEFKARLPFQGVAKQSGVWPAIWFLGDMLAEGPAPSYTCNYPTVTDGCWPWQPEMDLMEWQSPNGKMASNAIHIGADGNMDACNDWPEHGGSECKNESGNWNRNSDYNNYLNSPYSKGTWKINDWSAQGSAAVDGSAGSGYQGWHVYGLEWTDTKMVPWVDGVKQGEISLTGSASEFKQPMFIIMNLALGGDLGGVIQVTDWSKVTLEVDYMRWYQMGGNDDCTDPTGGNPPPPPPTGRSIASNLEAESNDQAMNVQFENTTDTGGGTNAGWIGNGSYIEWNVNVPSSGSYTVTSRSATTAASTYAIQVDGAQVATYNLPNTGGWQTWGSYTTSAFNMTAGVHKLRIAFTSAGQNLNWVKVNAATTTSAATVYVDGSYGGTFAGLAPGDYDMNALNALGIGNDVVSSIKIASGYQATLYQDWNFTGFSTTITGDQSALSGLTAGRTSGTWDNDISSIKVRTVSACTPTTCASQGKTCGSTSDGCGATLNCGTCGTGSSCSNNTCVANCTPTSCSAQGKNCGTISDGCGGNLTCGSCGTGYVCNNNVCAASCTPTTCAALGKNCGSVGDGCGGTLSCGSCTSPNTCGGAGTANVCGTSSTPACYTAFNAANWAYFTTGTQVSYNGINYTCANANCANAGTYASCYPGASGCPWGTVWNVNGACH